MKPLLRAQQLHAAVHWRVEPPFAMDAPDIQAQVDLSGRLAGAQLRETMQTTGFEPEALLVSSTVMTAAVTMQAEGRQRFDDAIQATCGLRPQGIVNAYMCTGWGYALRHWMRHTSLRRVAVAIVDLDPHNLAWQQRHPVIGPSGFGVTTLLFTLPEARDGAPRCSGPHANSAFTDLVMALRQHQAQHGAVPTFIPYMLPELGGTAERLLAKDLLGPNRNAELGHCFGADPWIGLIEWFTQRGVPGPQAALAGALAFNGYYTFAPIALDPQTRLQFRRLGGDAASLEAAVQGALSLQPATASSPLTYEELEFHA